MVFEDKLFFIKEIAEKLDTEALLKISALFSFSKKNDNREFACKLMQLAKQKEIIYVPLRLSNKKLFSYGVFSSKDEAVDHIASRLFLNRQKMLLLQIGDVWKNGENEYLYISRTERREFPKLDVNKILKENSIYPEIDS